VFFYLSNVTTCSWSSPRWMKGSQRSRDGTMPLLLTSSRSSQGSMAKSEDAPRLASRECTVIVSLTAACCCPTELDVRCSLAGLCHKRMPQAPARRQRRSAACRGSIRRLGKGRRKLAAIFCAQLAKMPLRERRIRNPCIHITALAPPLAQQVS
jgi:hypothetical protein